MRIPRKPQWKHQVKSIEAFHLHQIIHEKDWSIRKTAKMLNRSLGGVSEDIRLSHALRIYPEVNEFKTREEAIEYLTRKKRCRLYPCGSWTPAEIKQIVIELRLEVEGNNDAQYS